MTVATQLVNTDIDRVDAVNGPATGMPYLLFKSLDPVEVPAAEETEEVAKSEEAPAEETEEVAKSEEAPAEEAAEEVAKSEEAPAEEAAAEEVAKSESEDASKAEKTARALAVLRKAVEELAQSEAMEEDYSPDAFDLMDANAAIDYALGILAKFALTEAVAADVQKALHLEIHEKKDPEDGGSEPHVEAHDPGEPVEGDPAAPSDAPAPVDHDSPADAPVKTAKAHEEPLPSGLQEILDTFVESYARFKEAQSSGPEAALAQEAAEDDANLDAVEAPAPAAEAHATPTEPAAAPEAPAAHEAAPAEHHEAPAAHEAAPAAAEKAPEPHAAPAAHEEAPAAEKAPAAAEEDPKKKVVAKSMDDLVAEAVEKALADKIKEAQEPLLKEIARLESLPNDSGSPMLAGMTPDDVGNPLLGRGQQTEGVVAKGLSESATAQVAPGAYPLAEGLKGLYKSIQ